MLKQSNSKSLNKFATYNSVEMSTIDKVQPPRNVPEKDCAVDDTNNASITSYVPNGTKINPAAIDDKGELDKALKIIEETIKVDPYIAIDCEGDDLSRKGTIQLMSVATRKEVFLFDIKKLKSEPFELGLKTILENEDVKKLMFDCREDADALFHQFNVKLVGVLDIQLLEVIKRVDDVKVMSYKRRSDRTSEVIRLKSLLRCLEEHVEDRNMIEVKQRTKGIMCDWGMRPLEEKMLRYAAVDVVCLFKLFGKLHPNEEEMNRLEIASKIYVDLKRAKEKRKYNKYEHNGYLPIDVIPEKGRLSFDIGDTRCKKCKRIFPREEFSKTQLRNGNQLCRTCKRVKLDLDTEENRQMMYERQYESWDSECSD